MSKQHYIYKTTNTVNEKVYYGAHYGDLGDFYMGSGQNIKRALLKYGKEAFKKVVLAICEDEADLYETERLFINEQKVKDPNCYNLMEGGVGGFKHINENPESSKKRSLTMMGNGNRKGKTASAESRNKMRLAKLGKVRGQYNKNRVGA